MKSEDKGDSGGMSRAAKKRAKKKQKNKQKHDDETSVASPAEEATAAVSVEEKTKKRHLLEEKANGDQDHKKPRGILKQSSFASASSGGAGGAADKHKKSGTHSMEHHGDGHHDDDDDGGVEMNDVILSEDMKELLKSGEVSLKDILLLEEETGDTKQEAKSTNDEGDESDDMENENPFEELTSKQRGRAAMSFLVAPADLTAEDFYEEYWEKKALCVQGTSLNHRHRFDGFLSLQSIRAMTEKHTLHYGRDMNVTKYHSARPGEIKRRANIDPPPYQDSKTGDMKHVEVDSEFVWSQFDENAATIRLLCPHKHNKSVHSLLSLFELELGCMVGSNAYLTPAQASQGFAPHYDDIEAFCLQLEGKKRWKVYAPAKEDRLPRVSSEDFTEDDIKKMEPVLDVTLEPGDLLYMPRGWIHHGITCKDNEHSLHLTMSAMQQWAWVDFLELLMPEALEAAAKSETSVSLRTGLPRNFLDYMGAMHDQRDDNLPDALANALKKCEDGEAKGDENGDEKDEMEQSHGEEVERLRRMQQLQQKFRDDAKKRIMRVAKEAMGMVDAACDQIGKRFLSDRLPPALTRQELACTSEGQREAKVWPTTLCRLARPGIARLVLEEGKAIVYHCADNSCVYHEVPLSPLEYEVDDAPALEQLVTTVEPNWIPVSDLIHEGMEDKISIVQSLYDEGILAIVNPAANGTL